MWSRINVQLDLDCLQCSDCQLKSYRQSILLVKFSHKLETYTHTQITKKTPNPIFNHNLMFLSSKYLPTLTEIQHNIMVVITIY